TAGGSRRYQTARVDPRTAARIVGAQPRRLRADDKSVIVMAAKAYTSAEMKCAVDWVSETPGPSGPIYSARLRCTGQPAQPPSMINLIIRPDNAKQVSVAWISAISKHTKDARQRSDLAPVEVVGRAPSSRHGAVFSAAVMMFFRERSYNVFRYSTRS